MAHHHHHTQGESRPLRQIFLLLFTAAVSFVLGMIIGRSSASVQPIIKVTMPAEVQPVANQNYNFYKALPKGETTSLGSGINNRSTLPEHPEPEPVLEPEPVIRQTETPVTTAPAKKSTERSVPEPKSVKEEVSGSWILQASSNPREEDAKNLSKRLRSKGFKTEVKPVQVKGKTWYRIYVGPYTSASAAKEAAATLSRQEGLTPIARKL